MSLQRAVGRVTLSLAFAALMLEQIPARAGVTLCKSGICSTIGKKGDGVTCESLMPYLKAGTTCSNMKLVRPPDDDGVLTDFHPLLNSSTILAQINSATLGEVKILVTPGDMTLAAIVQQGKVFTAELPAIIDVPQGLVVRSAPLLGGATVPSYFEGLNDQMLPAAISHDFAIVDLVIDGYIMPQVMGVQVTEFNLSQLQFNLLPVPEATTAAMSFAACAILIVRRRRFEFLNRRLG